MSRTRIALLTVLTLLAGGVVAGAVLGSLGPQEPSVRQVDPAGAKIEVLEARSFVLDEPYTNWWREERPDVRSGLILVLRTDPELVRVHQSAMPVLYVGDETAERCNDHGENLVALVPAPLDAGGRVALDLATTPIYFGDPDLPERVDAAKIASELARALDAGAGPAALTQRAKVFEPERDVVYARDRDELDLTIADLIEFYSPAEVDLISTLRLPRSR